MLKTTIPATAFLCAIVFLVQTVSADDPAPASPHSELSVIASVDDVQKSALDPSFDTFVNIRLIQLGLGSQDADQLTDAALLLAEGERVLKRPHKVLSVDKLLQVATDLAASHRDQGALDRLESLAASLGKSELKAKIEAAKQIAGKPAAGPPPLDGVSPAGLATFQAYDGEITRARAIGDRDDLDAIRGGIEVASDLRDKQRDYLLTRVKEAIDALPSPTSAEAAVLTKLGAASRDDNKASEQASVSHGWTVAWGREINQVDEVELVTAMASGTIGFYLGNLFAECAGTLGANTVIQALKHRGQTFGAGAFSCQANIATYNHWKYVKLFGRKIKVSEPNTFQPYVRWHRR